MGIQVSQRAAGARNVTFHIWGDFPHCAAPAQEISLGAKGLKLSSLVWLIEEKMGLYLCQKPGEVWIPLESRNSIRFDHGLPVEGDRLYLDPFSNQDLGENPRRNFFLILDFDR